MTFDRTITKRGNNPLYETDPNEHKKKNFYVYKYTNKLTGEPFYIGKGKNYRASQHISDAKKLSESTPKLDMIRKLNFEKGVSVNIIQDNLEESKALALEVQLIREIGRLDLGRGPLLNKTDGDEGLSGGIDQYGYKRKGIARFITDMVHRGEYIQNMSELVRQYVAENDMQVKWVESRIIPHIQEMGNIGCHYKGPKIQLHGWQFSLDKKMIDVNTLSLETCGFLRVHGDLAFNEGFLREAPEGYNFTNQH